MDLSASLYDDMRKRGAETLMRWRNLAEAPQLSSLVDRTFLRMLEANQPVEADREHFLALWTRAMRWVLVDLARARKADKRGQGRVREPLRAEIAARGERNIDEIIDVHVALERLAEVSERDARIVELRYYGGCSWQEIADVLGGSAQDLRNEWRAVKASLRRLMDAPS